MSDSSTCPVCNTTAKVLRREDAGNDIHWECQRCGTFRVLGSAAGPFPQLAAKTRSWVAAGSYPPAAPTVPGVPHSGTRLLR